MIVIDNASGSDLVARILHEYHELPGLALTFAQAQRLWNCDAVTCRCTVEALAAQGILRWSSDGHLIRGDFGRAEHLRR